MELAYRWAYSLLTRGYLHDSDKAFQWVIEGMEKTFGADHELTLYTVHRIGIVYHNQRNPNITGRQAKGMKRLEREAKPTSPNMMALLPAEMIWHIVEFLGPDSFQVLRLLEQRIRHIIDPEFFKRYFRHRKHLCTVDSLKVLRDISAHSNLADKLESIELVWGDTCQFLPSVLGPELKAEIVKGCEAAWAMECVAMRREGPALLTEVVRNLARKKKAPAWAISSSHYPSPYGIRSLCKKSMDFWYLFNPMEYDKDALIRSHLSSGDNTLGPILNAIHNLSISGNEDVEDEEEGEVRDLYDEAWCS